MGEQMDEQIDGFSLSKFSIFNFIFSEKIPREKDVETNYKVK
jgi:hypothetical protein